MSDLYDRDFYGWTKEQAILLRAGRAAELDWSNIAEEIESMGRGAQEQLTNRLAVLLAHLLKWRYQPSHRGNSWRLTIVEQRRRIARLIRKNPSLKAALAEVLTDAYGDALLIAQRDTGLPESAFPPTCPWTFDQAIGDGEVEADAAT
jgi:ribosomal protein L29